MDKLSAMTTFARIVEKGSLTAAADALNRSLPSVVRTLAALEKHLGARLLNRTTRRLHLTDEGAQYLRYCQAILAAVDEAEAALASRQSAPQGKLAITAPVLFGRRYIAPLVSAFVARHPAVNADFLLLDRMVNVIEEGLDVGIRIGHLSDSSLVAIPVGEVRRVLCGSPKYLRRNGTPQVPADLREHHCVRFSALTPGNEWTFQSARREINVPVRPLLSCNQVDAAVAACASGLGLGMFLSYQVAPERAAKQLVYVLEQFEPPPLPVQVIYPHARLMSASTRAFVDSCVTRLRAMRFD